MVVHKLLFGLGLALALAICLLLPIWGASEEIEVENLQRQPLGKKRPNEKLPFFEHFLHDVFPKWINQRPNNENGTKSEYEVYAMTDESNDDAAHMSIVSMFEQVGELCAFPST